MERHTQPTDTTEKPPLGEKITKLLEGLARPVEGNDQSAYDTRFEEVLQEAGINIDNDLVASEVYLAVERAAYNGSAASDGYQLPRQFTFTTFQRFGHLLKDEWRGEAFKKALDDASRTDGRIPVNPYKERERVREQSEKLMEFVSRLQEERVSYQESDMRESVARAASSAGLSLEDPASVLEAYQLLLTMPDYGPGGIDRKFTTVVGEMLPAEVHGSREVNDALRQYIQNPRGFLENNPLRKPKTL